MKRKIRLTLIWTFLALTLATIAWFKLSQPRILVLHSYAPDYSWTHDTDTGLKRVLDSKLRYKVQWHYMDTKNHPDADFKRKAGVLARRAIDALHPDLIIAIDDDAQIYAVKEFAGNPKVSIVFAGINGSVDAYGYNNVNNATGIYERKPLLDLRRALSAMRGPNDTELGHRIMQIGDQSGSVKADIKEIEAFDWSPFKITDSNLVKTYDEWKKQVLSAKGKVDIILITNYHAIVDAPGSSKVVPPTELMQWTEANSPVPVVGIGGFMGEEGGMFAVGASGFEQGETSAHMAIEILDRGAIPKNIPQVMPRQFLVYIRQSLMAKRELTLPPIYEAFARASNNYFQ